MSLKTTIMNKNISLIEKIFPQIPEMSEVERSCKSISDFNGAHLSMLPSIAHDIIKEENTDSYKNAKSAFFSLVEEIEKYARKNTEIDWHVSLAAKCLLYCYYYAPNAYDSDKMEQFILSIKAKGLLR